MQKKWVDSLFLGTWHLPSGDVFRCAEPDLDYYFNRAKEYLGAGVPLPVCLEHQPTVGLSFHDRLAEQTKHTIGHCHAVKKENGCVSFLVDGDDEAHAIMRRNKYVSPEIRQDVMNTKSGQRFAGPSIVHLAVTPRPVQVTGKPHVSLSNRPAVSLSKVGVNVSLSSAILLSAKGEDMPFHLQLSTDASGHEHEGKGKGGGRFKSKSSAAHGNQPACEVGCDCEECVGRETRINEMSGPRNTSDSMFVGARRLRRLEQQQAADRAAERSELEAGEDFESTRRYSLSSKGDDKGDDMPFPPKDDEVDSSGGDETTGDDKPAEENLNDGVGEDLDGGGPIVDAPAAEPGDEAKVGAAIAELTSVFEPMGIMFHASSTDSALDMLEHVITAVKTHQATKGASGARGDDDLNKPDNNSDQNPDPNAYQEPEVAESPPIMMSANTYTKREVNLARKLVKTSIAGLKRRIDTAHSRGFITDKMKYAWTSEISGVKLSMSDLTDAGDLKPLAVDIKLSAIEEQMATGRPGPFQKPAKKDVRHAGRINPLRPISSTVSMSTDGEEICDPPGADDGLDGPEMVPSIMDRLTGGRWAERKNGAAK